MKAVCWYGKQDVRVEDVDEPQIINERDAIIRVTSTAICGSDLHLFNGFIPRMKPGDILGHEFMGEVVEVGKPNGLQVGDRVVVPFTISCGNCFFCSRDLYSLCDNSNPNSNEAELAYGSSGAGLFGYSHIYGGYAGGQAEYVRVPFADRGPIKIPNGLSDERVLFLSDILPTGYMAAENCDIHEGDTVAVWGCGPVGQFAVRSAKMLGAHQVIAIDSVESRLRLAESGGAVALNYKERDVLETVKELTGGIGPDSCIDAVGMEAHGTSVDAIYDKAKQSMRLATDRPHALRQAIQACRKGGSISIPGVYGGFLDKFNFGAAFAKGLTFRMGQTHVQKYLPMLLDRIISGQIDTTDIISHRMSLTEAPSGYELFNRNKEACTKIVLKPDWDSDHSQASGVQ